MFFFNFLELTRHASKYEVMPGQFEQDLAKAYVCTRQIIRPSTDFIVALKMLIVLIAAAIIFSFILIELLVVSENLFPLTIEMQRCNNENPILFFIFFASVFLFLIPLLFLKIFLIGIIKLYQHYAPEHIRRRCLFKPT